MTANIIILNGCSSSGKTTLAEKLQQLLPEPYQHISLDQYRDGMPMRVRGLNSPPDTEGARGLNVVPELRSEGWVTHIHMGDYADAVLSGMRQSIVHFADSNIPIIVDDLFLKPTYLQEYVRLLNPNSSWMVGVVCDKDAVAAREAAREGRFPGTGIAQLDLVHQHCTGQPATGNGYDVVVDTSELDPRQSAMRIIDAMQESPRALQILRS